MNLLEYTKILIKGYRENGDNLAKYLIRESKNAEKEYIDNEEYFEGLNKVIKLFYEDIDNQYFKRKNDVSIIKSIREEKGQSIEDLEGQVFPKENFNVFLPRVTGNLFSGNLPFQDVLFLESEISRAKELISNKSKIAKLENAMAVLTNYANDLSESEYWARQIAKKTPDLARRELFQWQSDYNKEKPFNPDVWERYNKHFLALYQNSPCNDIAYELEKSEKDFEHACLTYWKNTKKEVSSAITDIGYAIAVIKMLEWLETQKPNRASNKSDLSAFEIALKHVYLNKAGIEKLNGGEIAKNYKGVKSPKNIEQNYNDILKKREVPNKSQLKKVHDSLSEYPDIQKAIQNDIDKLN